MILVLISTSLSQALAINYLWGLFHLFLFGVKFTAVVLACGFAYQYLSNNVTKKP